MANAKDKTAQEAVDDVEETFDDAYEAAESWLERNLQKTRDRARAEPITMLAVAAGVGALIGAIFLR